MKRTSDTDKTKRKKIYRNKPDTSLEALGISPRQEDDSREISIAPAD